MSDITYCLLVDDDPDDQEMFRESTEGKIKIENPMTKGRSNG